MKIYKIYYSSAIEIAAENRDEAFSKFNYAIRNHDTGILDVQEREISVPDSRDRKPINHSGGPSNNFG